MALSNWDTLAFDAEGKSCGGSFVNDKNSVDIYKNWLYVRAPKMWVAGDSYTKPTIAEIHSGEVTLAGFEISAEREPQNGVFVFVKYGPYDKRRMGGGIGCYGYENTVAKVLAEHNRLNENSEDWCSSSSISGEKVSRYVSNFRTGEEIEHDHESEWVGVQPATLTAYFAWMAKLHGEDKDVVGWMLKCAESPAFRCNQGDAYFAEHIGFDYPATEVGKVEKPVLETLIKNMEQPK